MTRVVLHIGMHKTASTYIQKRLQANQPLLRQHSIRFEDDSKNQLKIAARRSDFKPWKTRLKQARKQGADLLISNEVLSHLLAHPRDERPEESIGDWLVRQFQRRGCAITLVAFLRDQPSYLNSHYAQQIRNFSLHCPFEAYAEAVMNNRHSRGQCDPERLFGWIRHHSNLKAHFLPYNGHRRNDPFLQLIEILDRPITANWRTIAPKNSQYGRLAVATSIRVQESLQAQGIRLSSKPARRAASHALLRRSRRYRWARDRFNGLTPELYQRIRDHYRPMNDRFAQASWGVASWAELFPADPPSTQEELGMWSRWRVEWESRELVRRLTAMQQKR